MKIAIIYAQKNSPGNFEAASLCVRVCILCMAQKIYVNSILMANDSIDQ